METPPYNALHNKVIRGAGSPNAHPKIKLPVGRDIEVNRGKDLLLLIMQPVEVRNRSQRTVILNSARNLLCEVVADLRVRRETPPLVLARAMEGAINGRVEREIPAPKLFVDNRTNLPSPRIGGKIPPLITNFGGQAKPNRPMPGLRNRHTRANVIANPHPPAIGLDGGEDVKASLKPTRKAVGDLQSFVFGVVRRQHTVDYNLGALYGEVAVDLDHGIGGGDKVGAVDLDFSVVLGAGRSDRAEGCKEDACDAESLVHPISIRHHRDPAREPRVRYG